MLSGVHNNLVRYDLWLAAVRLVVKVRDSGIIYPPLWCNGLNSEIISMAETYHQDDLVKQFHTQDGG